MDHGGENKEGTLSRKSLLLHKLEIIRVKFSHSLLRIICLVIVAVVGYLITFNQGFFMNDDINLVIKGFYNHSPFSVVPIDNFHDFMYRPIRDWLSYKVAVVANGAPIGIHLIQVAFHALTALLLDRILRHLDFNSFERLVSNVLWFAFPATVAAVGVFCTFGEQIVVFLFLLNTYAFLTLNKIPLLLIVTSVIQILGLMSKEYAVIFPFTFIFIYALFGEKFQGSLRKKQVALLTFVNSLIVSLYILIRLEGLLSISDSTSNYDIGFRFSAIFRNILVFLTYSFFPGHTYITNTFTPDSRGGETFALFCVAMLLFLIIRSYGFRGILLFSGATLISLAPVVLLKTVAQHQIYFFSIILAVILAKLIQKKSVVTKFFVLFLVTVVVHSGVTSAQVIHQRGGMLNTFDRNIMEAVKPYKIPASQEDLIQFGVDEKEKLEKSVIPKQIILLVSPEIGDFRFWIVEYADMRLSLASPVFFKYPIRTIYDLDSLNEVLIPNTPFDLFKVQPDGSLARI